MRPNLEFILSLLDSHNPAFVSAEDFEGPHGQTLRLWQQLGLLSNSAERNPVPSCPYCCEGVPYLLGKYYLCGMCRSPVEDRYLLRWRFDLNAFLDWLADALQLQGTVQQVDSWLWQLGSRMQDSFSQECFFRRTGPLTAKGQNRLAAYRQVLLLQSMPDAQPLEEGCAGTRLWLLELLRLEGATLTVADPASILRWYGTVEFDAGTGSLRSGDTLLGEVPPGTREYYLLACLAEQRDRFVPYADLKRYVVQHTSSQDTTEEATFCHKLKRRIKAKWVEEIDRLITTTNKGDGYRLRGRVEPW